MIRKGHFFPLSLEEDCEDLVGFTAPRNKLEATRGGLAGLLWVEALVLVPEG